MSIQGFSPLEAFREKATLNGTLSSCKSFTYLSTNDSQGIRGPLNLFLPLVAFYFIGRRLPEGGAHHRALKVAHRPSPGSAAVPPRNPRHKTPLTAASAKPESVGLEQTWAPWSFSATPPRLWDVGVAGTQAANTGSRKQSPRRAC